MSRAFAALLGCVAAALAIASPAAAHGIIERDGDVLRYSAPDPGFGAKLTISSPAPGSVEFLDRRSPGGMSWGPCLPLSEKRARCSVRGITRIEVEVFDGADVVRVEAATPAIVAAGSGNDRVIGGYGSDELNGGPGDDLLVGGARSDSFSAGDGNDEIRARDGVAERVRCGAGSDRVQLDERDDSSILGLLDCEAVEIAPAEGDSTPPAVRLAVSRPLHIGETGTLRVGAALDEPGELTLGGSILLDRRATGRLVADRARPNAPGQRWTLRPRVPRRLGARLRRHLRQGRPATAILVARCKDRAGNRTTRRLRVALAP